MLQATGMIRAWTITDAYAISPRSCVQERWFERDAEFVRAPLISAAAKQKGNSEVEITVNATGRQSLSPPRHPEHLGKASCPLIGP